MKNKFRKSFLFITSFFFILIVLVSLASSAYLLYCISTTPELNIKTIVRKKSSKIYDQDDVFVKQLTQEDYPDVTYEDLSDVFIQALLSCEDVRYFLHHGIDLPRLLASLKNNVVAGSFKEGGSTITQQLIKNMLLTSTKSIERKIQEAYLAHHIETIYSKKEILEFYCNYVCFDGVHHGVMSASYQYFNKPVSALTLPQAALLAGVVNLPTTYNPLLHPENAFKRKNVVLKLMLKNGFISQDAYEQACNVRIESIIEHVEPLQDTTYPYQAYIDIVYQQIKEKTGYDCYTTPMEIYTNMDTALQGNIDALQNNEHSLLSYKNELQQFASTILNNQTGAIIGCFGGRNYKGQKLLNRAFSMKKQPASTIKPLLSYALAFEHLQYSNKQTLEDVATYYPATSIMIDNVDHTYLGELSIADAIAFSRNTTAIATLQKVASKIGIEGIVDYLSSLHLMDEGDFTYSYGLGGFKYGVSITNLAAAYSMIARLGVYIEPLSVRYIRLLDTKEVITFTPEQKQVLEPSSCYLLIDTLKQVMDLNRWSIADCKPSFINLVAKTGTSSFDSSTILANHYPQNASKDRWLATFSPDYTLVSWTGFDSALKDKETYFSSASDDNGVNKKFCKYIYSQLATPHLTFQEPDGLKKVTIIKGSNNVLPSPQIEDKDCEIALFKENYSYFTYFEEDEITTTVEYDSFICEDAITFIFPSPLPSVTSSLYDKEKVLGGKHIYIDIYENDIYHTTLKASNVTTYPLHKNSYYHFVFYYKYEKGLYRGPETSVEFSYL